MGDLSVPGCQRTVPDRRVHFTGGTRGAKAIFPAIFLHSSLGGASPVAGADVVDAEAALGDLERDFGLEARSEPSFVAGLHVSHVHVGEGVEDEAVSDVVPEIEDAVRGGAEKAGSVDDVGFAFK